MRIALLTAGAGPMYCGSCLHANTLAGALRRAGEDAMLVPLYTPLRTDEEDLSLDRVAMGGINVYLRQKAPRLGRLLAPLGGLLDRPALLRLAARRGAGVHPQHLGPLTVSMLRGELGRQRSEVDKLVDWLGSELRPDLVHLNNLLLVGVARQIARRLGVPVLSTLSGEDSFLEKVPEPHYGEARALLRERAAELSGMAAMNGYYAAFMSRYLDLPAERIRVIELGLNLAGHAPRPARRPGDNRPLVIGFLARVCPDKGLHLLAEAFVRLAAGGLPPVRLHVAGYLDPAERAYLRSIRRRLAAAGVAESFEYLGQLDRAGKVAFLQSLDLLCVPTTYRESKGLFVLEAWANGVPVVLPDHGTFSEMVGQTGGGLLFEPGSVDALAAALRRMLLDAELAAECGRRGHQAVGERYHADRMARQTIAWYRELAAGPTIR